MKFIIDKKLQETIGWKPHKCQKEILKSKAKEIVISAGRGFGKTMLVSYPVLKNLLIDDKQILLVAPTYDLTNRVFEYVEKWIVKAFPSLRAGITYRPYPMIRTPWKSKLEGKSAENPTGMLGKRYDLTIVDEASKISRKVWEAYIYPTTQITGGRKMLISTPLGKNWFYDAWVRAKEDNGAFQYKSVDNPYFSRKDWELAKQRLPEDIFKQEYMAQFIEGAASVFKGVRDIVSDDCLSEPKEHKYILGVDLGKHNDFTVLTVLDKYTHKVAYWERFKKVYYPLQKERIIAVAKQYNNARVIIDSTGVGDPISDDLKHHGLIVDDYRFSNKSKQRLIDKLSIFIQQKAITIPNNNVLIDELEAFGATMSDAGNIKYSAPIGLHDDCVISLALAVWGLFSPKTGQVSRLYRQKPKKIKRFQYR